MIDLRMIPIEKLRYNARIMREANTFLIHRLTDPDENGKVAFDLKGAVPLMVVDNGDGTFNVVDGLLRWRCAERLGIGEVLCQVLVEEPDLRAEAELFMALNSRRRVAPRPQLASPTRRSAMIDTLIVILEVFWRTLVALISVMVGVWLLGNPIQHRWGDAASGVFGIVCGIIVVTVFRFDLTRRR